MENKTVLKGGLSIDWDFGHVLNSHIVTLIILEGSKSIKI